MKRAIAIWDLDAILPSYRGEPELRRGVVNSHTSAFESKRAFLHPENTTVLQRLLERQRDG